ncbi:GRIP and coiled-coil domain-containing protein C27D7.02c-like isoform X2 [Hermetia illucens]|nr:GRIP and coiled-coil domain-containing protein C27D7.02c-like isoform X2 [Hermetia illucens]
MGASKSKMLVAEISVARAAESDMRGRLSDREKECEDLAAQLEQRKQEYEQKYSDLELKHTELQGRFLELKSKFESDELSSGDYNNRASELNRKLNEALSERDFIKIEAQKQIEALLSNQKAFDDEIQNARAKLQQVEANYEERIRCLEMEQQMLLDESAEKDYNMQRMREESEDLQNRYEVEKQKLEEDFNRKGILLHSQFNEERAQLNMQWELKLSEEVSKFRSSLVQENSSLQEKLNTALSDIDSLSRKYKLLNNLFEEIRSRYERRESRKEDLERIADLEGQLIVQSEEIERQRDILKALKFPTQQNGNPNSRRNRRNARKLQQQKLNCNGTGNINGGTGKNLQRCRVSSTSSASSSCSETKGDN